MTKMLPLTVADVVSPSTVADVMLPLTVADVVSPHTRPGIPIGAA